MADEDQWRIVPIKGGSGTITHPVMAVTPGCPAERHPTRDCRCKPFRSKAQAQAYINTQNEPKETQ